VVWQHGATPSPSRAAADAAAREARRTLREKRKGELHANVDERVGKLKEKLQVS
jgi:hypothetical protein